MQHQSTKPAAATARSRARNARRRGNCPPWATSFRRFAAPTRIRAAACPMGRNRALVTTWSFDRVLNAPKEGRT